MLNTIMYKLHTIGQLMDTFRDEEARLEIGRLNQYLISKQANIVRGDTLDE